MINNDGFLSNTHYYNDITLLLKKPSLEKKTIINKATLTTALEIE